MKNTKRQTVVVKQKYFTIFALFIIVIAGIIVYSNSLDCSFHFDDLDHIVNNPSIHDIHDVDSWWNYSKYRPISTMTFVINYHFHQLDVFYYHLSNLTIHILNGLLVYFLILLLLSTPVASTYRISIVKERVAFFVAMFFVVHPLATQSVTYVIQRQAAMAALFYLLALCLYLYLRIKKTKIHVKIIGYFMIVLSFAISVLSKENAYTLPVIIVLTELLLLRKDSLLLVLKNYKTYIILIVSIMLGLIVFYQFSPAIFNPIDSGESYSNTVLITPWNYLLTQFSVIVKYIQLLVIPVNQNLDYDYRISQSLFELRTFLSFIFLSLIVGFAVFMLKRNRLVSFAIFWFFITLSIESSFIPLADVIFEHRTYLPSIGFIFAAVIGIYYALYDKRKNLFFVILISSLFIFSYLTYKRNIIWKDEFSLWNDIVEKSPEKPRAYANRGHAYSELGQEDMAFEDYSKAIELDSTFSIAWLNRGIIYANRYQYDQAIYDLSKAIDINSNFKLARWNRGVIYSILQLWDKAIIDYNKLIELDSSFEGAIYNRGVAYANLGNMEVALNDFEKTVSLKPDYPGALFNCAVANDDLGNFDQAIYYYSQTIKYYPNNFNAFYGRAIVLMNMEKWVEAYSDFVYVNSIAPDYPGLQQNITYVLFKMEGN